MPLLTPRRSRQLDELMVLLSDAAEHSKLWFALAAAGAATGGRRGRRAAADGIAAIAATSATVNGLKLLTRRRRPAPRRLLRRQPRTSSFPSGHAGSAFAFAVAATREIPGAGPLLVPLAAAVAYSRVYLGAHYPSDVLAGGAIGAAYGSAARSLKRRLGLGEPSERPSSAASVSPRLGRPTDAVLVVSPHAGHSRGLDDARKELERHGLRIAAELDIADLDRLPALLRSAGGEDRLVVAAGGDGTVGSVAARLVGTENVLGILPLGTGNDFARALSIPLRPRPAAELIVTGDVSPVDLGRLTREHQPPSYFVHAATAGLNVDFAKLATRASTRAKLGRLTYFAASVYALRERKTFSCTLEHDGVSEDLALVQLSVISAPVIGGSLGLTVRGPYREDHGLDVIAVEDVPPWRMIHAGVFLLLGIKRPVPGLRAMHVQRLTVDSAEPFAVALDGEPEATLPGAFDTVAGRLRVITPRA